MANLVDPWRDVNSPFSVNFDNIDIQYPELNKSNVFDNDPNFVTQAKNRSYFLYPWKITTLEALEQRGKARLDPSFSIGVENGKFISGYILTFKKDDPFLPIGDVGIVIPQDKNESINTSIIKSNILVPLIANDAKYSISLELKRDTDVFPSVTSSDGCPQNFGHFYSPSQEKITKFDKNFTGVGSVIMPPETPENKKLVRTYAAVKKQWLNPKISGGAANNPTYRMGRANCRHNVEMWFNTPFNTFRVKSENNSYTNIMDIAYGLKIDESVPVPKNAPPPVKRNKPLPPLEKSYTWVWIIVGIIIVISLFIFLYFVLK